MGRTYKVGQTLTNADGKKVVITSVLPNGSATVNYASGSGKTGYAGILPGNAINKISVLEKDLLNELDNQSDASGHDGQALTLEEYSRFMEEANGSLLSDTFSTQEELMEIVYTYHGLIPQPHSAWGDDTHKPNVHHFTATKSKGEVGFLQLFDGTHEVANIEVDIPRKGIGTGLIMFAQKEGFYPSRSEAESEDGEAFFSMLEDKRII